jgi:hypothetical protein
VHADRNLKGSQSVRAASTCARWRNEFRLLKVRRKINPILTSLLLRIRESRKWKNLFGHHANLPKEISLNFLIFRLATCPSKQHVVPSPHVYKKHQRSLQLLNWLSSILDCGWLCHYLSSLWHTRALNRIYLAQLPTLIEVKFTGSTAH